jgi:hypothetical protein
MFIDLLKRYIVYNNRYNNNRGWYAYRWALIALLIFPLIAIIYLIIRRRRIRNAASIIHPQTNQIYYQPPPPQMKQQNGFYPPPPSYPQADSFNANFGPSGNTYNNGPSDEYYPPAGAPAGSSTDPSSSYAFAPPSGPPPSHSKS